jgi:metal-responsive CopG/Arc/MetJ family transcriptional regulator
MKSILLKLDDDLFEETEEQVKELKTSRSNYLKTALKAYNNLIKRKRLETQIKKEIALLKENNFDQELLNDFDEASLVDLQKFLDEE